jgi:hypothetical protein
MNNNIKVLFYTFTQTQIKVLSDAPDSFVVPCINLDSLDSTKTIVGMNHVLKKIYGKYTNISFEWAKFKLLDIDLYQNIENNLFIDIYYCVFLPSETHTNNGYWLDSLDLVVKHPILRKMSSYV